METNKENTDLLELAMPPQFMDALDILTDLCKAHKLEWVLSGTCALELLGLFNKAFPDDIDIKVYNAMPEQLKWLKELDSMTKKPKNQCYAESNCFTFYIKGIKVNALIEKPIDRDIMLYQSLPVIIRNNTIRIQKVQFVLTDKMNLRRPKDMAYMINLINNLSSL